MEGVPSWGLCSGADRPVAWSFPLGELYRRVDCGVKGYNLRVSDGCARQAATAGCSEPSCTCPCSTEPGKNFPGSLLPLRMIPVAFHPTGWWNQAACPIIQGELVYRVVVNIAIAVLDTPDVEDQLRPFVTILDVLGVRESGRADHRGVLRRRLGACCRPGNSCEQESDIHISHGRSFHGMGR